jgi:hypothetical protein
VPSHVAELVSVNIVRTLEGQVEQKDQEIRRISEKYKGLSSKCDVKRNIIFQKELKLTAARQAIEEKVRQVVASQQIVEKKHKMELEKLEEQMVAVETFPDVNYSLELEGRECLVTCGAGTLDDKWLFPHFDNFIETPSEPPLIAEETVLVKEEVETVGVCSIGLVPNSSVLSARVKGGGEPNGLERTFDFLHLRWTRAMKRNITVYKAALKPTCC